MRINSMASRSGLMIPLLVFLVSQVSLGGEEPPKSYSSPTAVFDAYREARIKRDARTVFSLWTPQAQNDAVFEAFFGCMEAQGGKAVTGRHEEADAIGGLESLEAKVKAGDAAYDYIFIDPPYAATADYARALQRLGASRILAERGIVIVEHRKTFDLSESFGTLKRVRLLRQGDAALSFYRREETVQSTTNADNL